MSPIVDLDPLLPSDEQRAVRRDALVAELERAPDASAAPRAPRLRTTRRVTLGLAVAAGLALAFVVVPRSGGPDVVASARAAISAPQGGILHVKVRYEPGKFVSMASFGGPDGETVGRLNGVTERWTAQDPYRERLLSFLDTPTGGETTTQEVHTPRTYVTRNAWEGRTNVARLSAKEAERIERSREQGAANLERLAVGTGQDPIGGIRKLLETGALRHDGETEFAGRDAVRLVSKETGSAGGPAFTYEYLVDATSYRPLRVTAVQVIEARPNDPEPAARKDRRIVDRWVFETFERLPLNAQTQRLLEIDPSR